MFGDYAAYAARNMTSRQGGIWVNAIFLEFVSALSFISLRYFKESKKATGGLQCEANIFMVFRLSKQKKKGAILLNWNKWMVYFKPG